MAQRFKDMTGQRFTRLTCITPIGSNSTGMQWECKCDCGNIKNVQRGNLISGTVKSCGCLREEINKGNKHGVIHGKSGSKTYASWEAMIQRCCNPKSTGYASYGGRGIIVCESWKIFDNFIWDMGERPIGKTLDRINVNGNYEKVNCRWATVSEQNYNKRPRL